MDAGCAALRTLCALLGFVSAVTLLVWSSLCISPRDGGHHGGRSRPLQRLSPIVLDAGYFVPGLVVL